MGFANREHLQESRRQEENEVGYIIFWSVFDWFALDCLYSLPKWGSICELVAFLSMGPDNSLSFDLFRTPGSNDILLLLVPSEPYCPSLFSLNFTHIFVIFFLN